MAWEYFRGMMQFGTFRAGYRFFTWPGMWPTNLFIVIMLVVEWIHKNKQHGLGLAKSGRFWLHILIYLALFLGIEYYFMLSIEVPSSFIYFQF